MRKMTMISIMVVMTMALGAMLATDAHAVTNVTTLIRAGQTISSIQGTSSTSVSVTLGSAYPNNNLKVGQNIAIIGTTNYNSAIGAPYQIATVTDQLHFTYTTTGANQTLETPASATAGGDYTTLEAWQTGRTSAGTNLVTRDVVEIAECYNDWLAGLPVASGGLVLSGFIADSTHYIKIYTPDSERHKGYPMDGSAYTGFALVNGQSGTAYIVDPASQYTRIEGIIIDTKDSSVRGMRIDAYYCLISKCIILNGNIGIFVTNSSNGSAIVSCILLYANSGSHGILTSSGTNYIYNCTVVGFQNGFNTSSGGTSVFTNCLGYNNSTDFNLVSGNVSSYCASKDASAGSSNGCRSSQTFSFANTAKNDYRLAAGDAGAATFGKDLSLDANFPFNYDISGYTRTVNGANTATLGWDIGASEAPVEFISAIRASGKTAPATDYISLSLWYAGCKGVDYTLNTTRVFSGVKTGAIADGASVTLYRNGSAVSPSVTGTAVHAGASQILVKIISNGAYTFQVNDQWYIDATNMFQITDVGNTAVPVGECYNDWSTGLSDTGITFSYGTTTGMINDAQHKVILRTPTSQRHAGKAYSGGVGFWVKSTVNGPFFTISPNAGYIKIDGIEINETGNGNANIKAVYIGGASNVGDSINDIEVTNCIIHHNTASNSGFNGIYIDDGSGNLKLSNIKVYNNIIYDVTSTTSCGISAAAGASGSAIYLYNNTVYNCVTGISAASTTTCKNNIAISDLGGSVCFTGAFTSAYNCSSDATATGTGSLTNKTSSATFTTITAGSEDLHLKSTATISPCIGAGVNLYTALSIDTDSESRPSSGAWSMGADEYVTFTWTGTTSTAWGTNTNWSYGGVTAGTTPTASATVIIPNTTNKPVIPESTTITIGKFNMTGGTLTLHQNVNLIVQNDVICSGGQLIPDPDGGTHLTNYIITCGGNLNLTGCTFTYGTSTIIMNGSGGTKTVTIPNNGIIFNITFNGSSTFLLNPNTTNNMNVYGAWTVTSGTIDPGTSAVSFSPNAVNQSVLGSCKFYDLKFPGTYWYSLSMNSTTTLTVTHLLTLGCIAYNPGGNINVLGDVAFIDDSLHRCYSPGVQEPTVTICGAGNQTITGTPIGTIAQSAFPNVVINKQTGTLTLLNFVCVSGDWTYMRGTIVPGTSTVLFTNNQTSCTISGSLALNNIYFSLPYNGTFSIAAGTTLTANGKLWLNGDNNGYNNYLNGSGTINVLGNVVVGYDNSPPCVGSATINLCSVAGPQTITYTPFAGRPGCSLPNIIINNANGVSTSTTYSAGILYFGAVTIQSGTLSLGGNTTFTDNVTIQSGGILSCFTPDAYIKFYGAKTVSVQAGGSFNAAGTSGHNVNLNVYSGTTPWNLQVATAGGRYYIDYVNATYSSATGYQTIYYNTNSASATNCTNWTQVSSPGGTTCTWNGTASTGWFDSRNWASSRMPTSMDDVTVNNGTFQPTVPAGTYVYKSLTVNASAIVTCQGNQADVNAASGGTTTVPHGSGVTFNITNNVAVTGTIKADAQGFSPACGPGAGGDNGTHGGAGYGGFGECSNNTLRGGMYGSVTQPTALGSGGGGSLGGRGGGAIKINAPSGTVTINGTVSANGADNINYQLGGGGSGGSIWIIGNTMAGSGTISSTGGAAVSSWADGYGAGGRIRLTWASGSPFGGTITASAGMAAGVLYPGYNPICHGTYSFPDNTSLTVKGNMALAPGTYSIPTLTVNNGYILQCQGDTSTTNGSGVTINSTTITVNGAISADGLGFNSNLGPGAGTMSSGGAGYGGLGGYGGTNSSSSRGGIYGSATKPTALGSGGGGNYCNQGGGAIKLVASSLTINGTVSANGIGQIAAGIFVGEGSGGSIWIISDTLAGSGSVSATGGLVIARGYAYGAGGGGRVAIYTASYANTLTSVTAAGGTTTDTTIPPYPGVDGTIFWAPIGGYTAENVIPAAACSQSAFADGVVTVALKVKDPGDTVNATSGINGNHKLTNFEYSTDNGSTFTPAAVWSDSDGYHYCKKITIAGSKVYASLTDFPMLVNITVDPDLATTSNYGHVESTNVTGTIPYDITFRDTDQTTKLSYEIEKYDPLTGQLIAWVKIPALTASTSKDIYIYYGKTGLSSSQSPGVPWDGYYNAVWHLNDPTTPTDSTGNGYNGTNHGVTATSGQILGAGNFNGTSSYINTGTSILNSTQNHTVELWVKGTTSSMNYKNLISVGSNVLILEAYGDKPIVTRNTSLGAYSSTSASTYNWSNWHHIAVVYDASQLYDKMYVDGVDVTVGNSIQWGLSATNDINIGRNLAGSDNWPGIIDEVRISSTNRVANWIKTEYANQSSPSTFYTVYGELVNGTTPSLSGGWPLTNCSGAYVFTNPPNTYNNTFTFNTKDASLTGFSNAENSNVKIRIKIEDTVTQSPYSWYAPSNNYATSDAFTVDNKAPVGLSNLQASAYTSNSVTLTWTAVTSEANFNTYEMWYGKSQSDVEGRSGTATKIDKFADGNLNNYLFPGPLTVSSLDAGTTYYFKLWAKDNYGNLTPSNLLSRMTNNKPFGGFTADDVIPAAQCVQANDASGKITISFRVKDADTNGCKLKTFQYSVDGGSTWNAPTGGDSSTCLEPSGWTDNSGIKYPSAIDWNGTIYNFVFNTKSNDVSGMSASYHTNIKVRFTVSDYNVNDYMNDSVLPATSANFEVDNAVPTALANLAVASVTNTTASLTWTSASDDHFKHYEIWYGTSQADVISRTAGSGAAKWDEASDATLTTMSTGQTTITGLTPEAQYYFKIWAVDNFGNETTIADVNHYANRYPHGGYTAEDVIPASNCVQKVDLTGKVTIKFKIQDSEASNCTIKDFCYSTDGVNWSAPVQSGNGLPSGWSSASYTSASTFANAADHSFDFDTSNITGIKDVYNANVKIRFKVSDGTTDSEGYVTSQAFAVDNAVPVGPTNLAVSAVAPVTPPTNWTATLTWVAATDNNFDHYEVWYGTTEADVQSRSGTAAKWSVSNDANLANHAITTTGITGLTKDLVYYFKIWAMDIYGHETTNPVGTTTVNQRMNNPPIGGYSADNVIPGAQCNQSITADGKITIHFKITDSGANDCTLSDFEYSLDGGATWYTPTNGDNSGCFTLNWVDNGGSKYHSATTWSGATAYSFKFNTQHADLSNHPLSSAYYSTVQIRFRVHDTYLTSANYVTSTNFAVDNKSPAGMANLEVSATTADSATLRWTKASDDTTDGFNYEIWYGTVADNVINRSSPALVWDSSSDSNMGNINTSTTTITTGLAQGTIYYFMIFATDYYGNWMRNPADTPISGALTGLLTSVSVTPESAKAGTTTQYTLAFTTQHAVSANGEVRITFDNAFDVSGASYVSGTNIKSVAVEGKTVVMTLKYSVQALGNVSIVMGGIKNPVVTKTTSAYLIYTKNPDGSFLDSGIGAGTVITTGDLSGVSVTPASYVAGAITNHTFAFTTANPIPQNGDIQVTFDGDYDLMGTLAVVSGNQGATVSAVGNVLTIKAGTQIPVGGVSIVISGIKNPKVTQTTTGPTLVTRDVSHVPIDSGTASGVAITAGALTIASITPVSYAAGDTTSYGINFTTANPIPQNGFISISFDSHYNLAGVTSVSGSCTPVFISKDGNLLVIKAGALVNANTAVTLTVPGVKNPIVTQTTANFALTTKHTDGTSNIDTATVTGLVITPGAITSASITPSDYKAGAVTSYGINFTTANPIPQNGFVSILFDSDYDLTGVTSVSGNSGASIDSKDGNLLVIKLGTAVEAATSVTLTVSNVKNPIVTQTTTNFELTTKDTSANGAFSIDTATVNGLVITPGTLTIASITPVSRAAGASTSYAIGFTTVNPIPQSGYVSVSFDSDYDLTSVTSVSGNSGATIDSKVGNLLVIKLGTDVGATTSVTLTVPNVKNPIVTQTTTNFALTTKYTDGTSSIDTATVNGITIITGLLGGLKVNSEDNTYPAGDSSKDYIIQFTTANPIPVDGNVRVTFPAGYNISGASYNAGSGYTSVVGNIASKDGQVLLINLDETEVLTPRAVSIAISGIKNPGTTGMTGTFSAKTQDTASHGYADIDAATTASGHLITIGRLQEPIAIDAVSTKAGALTSYTIGFKTTSAVPALGYVQVDFPSGYDLTNPLSSPSGSVSVNGNKITITLTNPIAAEATASITVNGIKNPPISGKVTDYTIKTTTGAGGSDIDTGTATGETITPGDITNAAVTSSAYTAGVTANYTVAFTVTNAVPSGGRIIVTFDDDYDLTGAIDEVSGTHSVTVSHPTGAKYIVLTLNQWITTVSPNVSIVISGIKNPSANQTTTDYIIQTQSSDGIPIDEGTAPGKDIAGELTGENVLVSPNKAGATASYTIGFTTAGAIQSGGNVRINFDSDCDISGATLGTNNISGTIASKNNNILVITTGNFVDLGTLVSIIVNGIKNPSYVQTTDEFVIKTYTSGNSMIDSGAAAGKAIIVNDGLAFGTVVSTDYKAGATATYTFPITLINALASGDKIDVTLDADYTFPSGLTVSGDASGTATVANHIITVTLNAVLESGSQKNLIIAGIKNPTYVQTTDAFTVTTKRSTGESKDTGASAVGAAITANVLTVASVTPSDYKAGATTDYTFQITPVNSLTHDEKMTIIFDSDYTFPGPLTVSGDLSGTATVNGGVLTYILGSGESLSADSHSITISGIKNPTYLQTTDAFTITTKTSGDANKDAGNHAGVGITANVLTVGAVASTDYKAGATATYTLPITLTNALVSGDKIDVTLDADYTFPSGLAVSGDASGTATVANHIITVTLNAVLESGSQKNLIIAGIKNPTYVQTTDAFTVTTKRSTGESKDTGASAVGAAITANVLTVGAVASTDYKAVATATYTLPITLTNDLISGDKIDVTFDSDYTFPGALTVSGDVSGTATANGHVVTVTVSAGVSSGSQKNLTIAGVKNPTYVQATDAFTVTTKKSTGESKDSGTSASGVNITHGTLTNISVNTVSGTYRAGVTEPYTIAFTAENPIPAGGRIRVTFDSDYDLSAAAYSSGNANSEVTSDGSTLIITTGTSINAGAVSVVVSGIRNPVDVKTSAACGITTKYSDTDPGSDIDIGTATAGHAIISYLEVTSPASGGKWAVNENMRQITWNTGGNIDKVRISYSTDNNNWTEIVTNYTPANYTPSATSSYTWSAGIPDLVTAAGDPQVSPEVTTYIKVEDLSGRGYNTSPGSIQFKVIYYTITWAVKDSMSLAYLAALNVNEFGISQPNYGWSIADSSLNSPVKHNYSYGTYTTTFSKKDYFEMGAAGWVADSSKTIQVLMDTTIQKQWFVYTGYAYDAVNDKLNINVWVVKEGLLMPSNTAGATASVTITDSTGTPMTASATNLLADANGVFWFTVDTSTWDPSKVYFAKSTVTYGGAPYTSGQGIAISLDKQLQSIKVAQASEVATQSAFRTATTGTLLTVESATTGAIPAAVANVASKVDTVSGKVDAVSTQVVGVAANVNNVNTNVSAVKTTVTAILENTSVTLPAQIRADVVSNLERGVLTEILTRNSTIREDETIMIRYRTATGLKPKMTIYNEAGAALSDYTGKEMKEIGKTGIYEYKVMATSAWTPGDYTVSCEELTKASKDSMVLSVVALYVAGQGVQASLDSLGYAVTKVYARTGTLNSILGTNNDKAGTNTLFGKMNSVNQTITGLNLSTVATDVKEARTNAYNAYTQINSIKSNFDSLQTQISALKNLTAYLDEMRANVAKMSQDINTSTKGANKDVLDQQILAKLATMADNTSAQTAEQTEIKNLNNKIEELSAMTKILKQLIESSNNKPVVEGWFEK